MERKPESESKRAALFALAAAVLYACSVPLSKQLLMRIDGQNCAHVNDASKLLVEPHVDLAEH